MVDNGYAVWESRVIITYLVEKYGKDDSLYPKCPKKRAVVNQRLYFDMGTVYARLADYYYPVLFFGAAADPEKLKKLEDGVAFLNTFLEGNTYAAGDTLTVADISLVSSVSALTTLGFDISKYPNVDKWYAHTSSVCPGRDILLKGKAAFKAFLDSKPKLN